MLSSTNNTVDHESDVARPFDFASDSAFDSDSLPNRGSGSVQNRNSYSFTGSTSSAAIYFLIFNDLTYALDPDHEPAYDYDSKPTLNLKLSWALSLPVTERHNICSAFVQIGTATGTEAESRARTGIEIDNRTGVEIECEQGIRIKRVIGIESRTVSRPGLKVGTGLRDRSMQKTKKRILCQCGRSRGR
ncbi:hypothetical protein EVAR_18354_1 [Eumeta japonica]|uniref:Uncharacterized protein n=1 Tax=Eumeta variegata TaxID=151549 RepID=A0A4C1V8M4_EUMVA|nr:hypothetical protein EVAR_18354_1 [Eumeta japonica]